MRSRCAALLVVIGCVFATAPAWTVTNGQPDGDTHPYVGVAIQFIPSMPGFVTVCSGAAISQTTFLTAAHCFDPSLPVYVSFKSGPPLSLAKDFTTGTFHPDPDWCLGCRTVSHGSTRTMWRSSCWTRRSILVSSLHCRRRGSWTRSRWERQSISWATVCRGLCAAAVGPVRCFSSPDTLHRAN